MRLRTRITAVAVMTGASLALSAGTASANMCSPSNLPGLSFMYPKVQSCQITIPGAGSLSPNIPQVIPGAPSPNYVPPWGSYIPIPRGLRGIP